MKETNHIPMIVTINEAKKRVQLHTSIHADKGYTFRGIFRKVMKDLRTGDNFDKGLYIAIKEAGSTKIVKNWIDEKLDGMNRVDVKI